MRDGDIYRWSYKDAKAFMPYHCKSQIAVFRDGRLRDTFWCTGSDNSSWTEEEAAERLDLRFVANFDEFEKADKWQIVYYDRADWLDLSHANSMSGQLYIRKGAKRSRARMDEILNRHIQENLCVMARAKANIDRYNGIGLDLAITQDLDSIHIPADRGVDLSHYNEVEA